MKVGILGSGDVGRALGRGFAARGHDVKIGSRNPKSKELQAWLKETKGKGSTGSPAEAAVHGEVIVLAVLGAAVDDAIDLAGRNNFDGKVVIDPTNPLDFSKGMSPGLFVGTTDSLGERIQRRLPKARVVKCFNIVGNVNMVDPKVPGGPPDMLIAGDDAAAKTTVTGILKEFGWPGAIDIGRIDGSRWLEAIVPLWVRVCTSLGNWNVTWKVLRG
jgi:8-hydroxy-5-deazaflavin:NADPH oxidoreductase